MKWNKKQFGMLSRGHYEGRRKKIKIVVDQSHQGWYFYGGGYNSLSEGEVFATLETAQAAAEMWIDENHKTARKDY